MICSAVAYFAKRPPDGARLRAIHSSRCHASGLAARGSYAPANVSDHAVKHARPRLRALGVRRPADREALLATYLDRQRGSDPEPELCECGCGKPVQGRRKYVNDNHAKVAYRVRKSAA